jgi:hypothetical protein
VQDGDEQDAERLGEIDEAPDLVAAKEAVGVADIPVHGKDLVVFGQ